MGRRATFCAVTFNNAGVRKDTWVRLSIEKGTSIVPLDYYRGNFLSYAGPAIGTVNDNVIVAAQGGFGTRHTYVFATA